MGIDDEIHVTPLMSVDNPDQSTLDQIKIDDEIKGYGLVEQVFPIIEYSDSELAEMLHDVKIVDNEDFNLDEAMGMVHLLEVEASGRVEEHLSGESLAEETLVRFVVSQRELNIRAGKEFYRSFRENALAMKKRNVGEAATLGILGTADYTQGGWLPPSDLFDATQDWQVPAMLHRRDDQGHYTLALEAPSQDEYGNWRVLVYDPMVGGEVWDSLPDNFNANLDGYQQWEDLNVGLYLNSTALQQLKNNEYHFSVAGDEELADNANVYAGKMTEVQFDGSNCGPACLFVAAMRSGLQEQSDFLQKSGRGQMYKDTGVIMYSKDEVLGRKQPPKPEDLIS